MRVRLYDDYVSRYQRFIMARRNRNETTRFRSIIIPTSPRSPSLRVYTGGGNKFKKQKICEIINFQNMISNHDAR